MLSAMTSTSDRLAAQLDRLPRGARAGLLAVSVAAAFAVAGSGAQASPVKGEPAGPTVFLDGPGPSASDPVFDFKSPDADEFVCSLDDAEYATCKPPVAFNVNPGWHTFRVRAVDLKGVAGPAAESKWSFTGPTPIPTATPGPGNR
jgi:hypothetical protein